VTKAGSIGWFAAHEARLAWRDLLSLMTAGRRRSIRTVILGFLAFAVFMHALAWLMLRTAANVDGSDRKQVLVAITGGLLMAWSLMLSQALESVTRAFYARGDLDLILSSPVAAERLFAVRIAAMAVAIVIMALGLAAPFINVLAWFGGAGWLCAYVVAMALAMVAVAVAVAATVGLFRLLGPRRTRAIAQVVAAMVGAAFAITIQFAAILSYGTTSRTAVMQSRELVEGSPDVDSLIWWPARAVLGEPVALFGLLGFGMIALVLAIRVFAPRFGWLALTAGGQTHEMPARRRRPSNFRAKSPAQALRRKEWVLLLRDPWLISQTLMQLFYLLPAALLLWRSLQSGGQALGLLVPILIVAAGQLGGGLAWLAVSGEDAPELIATAPVSANAVFRAKTEAVLGGIAAIFCPFVLLLAIAAPFAALVAMVGALIAAASATAIQYWFRTQARRSLFRRRQTSSRVATFSEAVSSTLWAATGAVAATHSWLFVVPGLMVAVIVLGTWMISPARSARALA
jgi:ABC-2 type transport system permease protein